MPLTTSCFFREPSGASVHVINRSARQVSTSEFPGLRSLTIVFDAFNQVIRALDAHLVVRQHRDIMSSLFYKEFEVVIKVFDKYHHHIIA